MSGISDPRFPTVESLRSANGSLAVVSQGRGRDETARVGVSSSAQCKKAESALTEPKASPDAFVAGNARWALELPYRIDAAKETYWALDEKERDAILSRLPKNVKPEIMRFKGLGEMMPEQLKQTTLDPRRRRALKVTVPNALEAERVLGELMGKDAAARYRFITERAREADNLDV
jgi:DNA gyrase B subunit, carboxyl terminus